MLCLLLRPMAFSSDNDTSDTQPSNGFDDRYAIGKVFFQMPCLEMQIIILSHWI